MAACSGPGQGTEVDKETDPLLPAKPSAPADDGDRSLVGWLQSLRRQIGYRFLVLIVVVHHLLRGLGANWIIKSTPFLFRSYSVPATEVQVYHGIVVLPWAIKPIIGIFSDLFPVLGYNKSPYMLLALVLGVASLFVLGGMPHPQLALGGAVLCLFFKSLSLSTCDLLVHAKCAEKVAATPQRAPDLYAFLFMGAAVAGLVSNLTAGPMIEHVGPKLPFLLAGIMAVVACWPVARGYMDEQRRTPEEAREARKRILEQGGACFLCAVMLASAVIMALTSMYNNKRSNLIQALSVAAFTLLCYTVVLSPTLAKVNAYIFVTTVVRVGYGGATFYFYTNPASQYPDGPHLSKFYYVTVLGTAASVFHILGVLSYQRFLKSWKYRKVLILTNFLITGLHALDVLVFARVTKRIGIPDHVCVLGLAIFEDVVLEWLVLPMSILQAHLCPKGMEAIIMALLSSSHILATTINLNIGAFVLDRLHVRPAGGDGEGAQFDNLWIAAVISMLLPFLATFALLPLVPDAHQDERLFSSNDPHVCTSGSLFERYVRRRSCRA